MDRAERRRNEQRARREAAEAAESEAFAHYGIDAVSEPLAVADPPLTTRVVRVGHGPPTVLFHGSALTSTAWAPLLPHLPGRSLSLVDLPGCGLADPFDHRGIDLAAHQTAFVGSVLEALGLESAALVGASMGGWFALRFAIERPERVVALALVTAPAVTPPPSARMTRRMLATIGGKGSVAGVPDVLFDALGAATALSVPSSVTLDLYRWRTPHPHLQVSDAELAACHAPVLLVWGRDDEVQAPEAGERAGGQTAPERTARGATRRARPVVRRAGTVRRAPDRVPARGRTASDVGLGRPRCRRGGDRRPGRVTG